MVWPEQQTSILKDLNSPACKTWRDLPEGWFPVKSPNIEDECYSLQSFLYYRKINLKSQSDYNTYLLRARAKAVIIGLTVWLIVALGLYVLGWLIGWIARGFSRKAHA